MVYREPTNGTRSSLHLPTFITPGSSLRSFLTQKSLIRNMNAGLKMSYVQRSERDFGHEIQPKHHCTLY